MEVDLDKWSGEGEFTQAVVDRLRLESGIDLLRVEDAPSSRAEAQYNFISNELYVRFSTSRTTVRGRVLGVLPVKRVVETPCLTLAALSALLGADPAIGPPDYADDALLQYLRTQRIVPPYQTRGYKLVELVRVYEIRPLPVPY